MNALVLKLLNMSISASWLVLAVLLLRLFFKKAPRWISCLMWSIVAVRLIMPLSFESTLSLIPSAETVSPEIMMDPTPEVHTGIGILNSAINPIISESFTPNPIASMNPLQLWIPLAAVVWILGVIAMLGYTVISYLLLRRKVATAVLIRNSIYQSEYVDSPFVLGILRPRIYLPFRMDSRDLEHVIAHEESHILRKDHWWKPLGFLLLTVYWFNPLLWIGYILLCRDIELACDEKVIREMDNETKADYTQALLSCSVNRRRIAACPLAFGEVGVKERVKSVMHYKKPAFWAVVAAILICVLVAVCFLTDPHTDNEQKPSVTITNQGGSLSGGENRTDLENTYIVDKDTGKIYGNTEDSATTQPAGRKLSLDDVMALSGKGYDLSWSDFEGFDYDETGSGLYIRVYGINGKYEVWIGGQGEPDQNDPPMYIYLTLTRDREQRIDIRDGGVAAFIEQHSNTANPDEKADARLDEAITAAIMQHNQKEWPKGMYVTESHRILDREQVSGTPAVGDTEHVREVHVFVYYLHLAFFVDYTQPEDNEGVFSYAAITFSVDEAGAYTLKTYCEPYRTANLHKDVLEKYEIIHAEAVKQEEENNIILSDRCWAAVTDYVQYKNAMTDQTKTYKAQFSPTPADEVEAVNEKGGYVVTKSYGETMEGKWVCNGQTYRYRLVIAGRPHKAAKKTAFVVLSNTEDITFDQTWQASGISSSMADYFDPAEAVIVACRLYE